MRFLSAIQIAASCATFKICCGYANDCNLVTVVGFQPVAYICSETTILSRTSSTYVDCEPTSCVPVVGQGPISESTCADDCVTITTTGPHPGTTTYIGQDGKTTVFVTTPESGSTLATLGPIPTTPTTLTESGPGAQTPVIIPPTSEGAATTSPRSPSNADASDTTGSVRPTDSTDMDSSTIKPPKSQASSTTPSGGIQSITYPPSTLTTTTAGSTSTSTSSTTSSAPTCSDLPNGDFGDGTQAPWYISDQVTADSSTVVEEGVEGHPYSFALIPSQDSKSQVYLNNYLPSCGDPPPTVTLKVSFHYQFTGASTGCSIGVAVNRSPDNIIDIQDDGTSPGEWQFYQGDPIDVKLSYDPLFTVKLACEEDMAEQPAIYITAISAY